MKQIIKALKSLLPHNVLYNRLENLYWYAVTCNLKSSKIPEVDFHVEDCNDDYKDRCAELKLLFKSCLGTVTIHLFKGFFNTGYDLSYANYAGSTVFDIKSHLAYNEIKPMLGDILTAKDIDLALYELEQYLNEIFGDIQTLKSNFIEEQKRKQKLHEQELNKLL